MIAPAETNEDQIADRMQEVRRRGHANAYHLRVGVDRASDWKEHVKAYPIPAVIAAALVGYWATIKVLPKQASTGEYLPSATPEASEQATKATVTAGLAAFAGSVVSNIVRQYARGYIDNYIHGLTKKERS